MAARAAVQRLWESEHPAWAVQAPGPRMRLAVTPPQRDAARIATNDPALLRILEPSSAVRWLARVVEVSRTEVTVLAQVAPQQGSLVQVHVRQMSVLGLVRGARAHEERPGYSLIEIEIQRVF